MEVFKFIYLSIFSLFRILYDNTTANLKLSKNKFEYQLQKHKLKKKTSSETFPFHLQYHKLSTIIQFQAANNDYQKFYEQNDGRKIS